MQKFSCYSLLCIIALILVASNQTSASGGRPAPTPEILDASREAVTEIYAGKQLFARYPFTNYMTNELDYVSIAQIKDQNGFTVQLSWVTGHVKAGESASPEHSWVPENSGKFVIELFVWTDLNEPTPITATGRFTVLVYSFVKILEGSSNPEQEENFSPKVIRVVLGVNNTVVWLNEDTAGRSITSDLREFDSGMMLPNQTWSHTFTKTGIYGYHSEPGPWLKGTVIVLTKSSDGVAEPAIICGESPYRLKYTDIMKYPDLIRNITNANSASCNYFYESVDGRNIDRITIRIAGKQLVEGDWRTGYTVSYINNMNITLLRDSETKELFDIDVVQSPDTVRNLQFNDYRAIINFAMQEDLARRFLDSDEYYVANVQYFSTVPETCYEGSCALIVVYRINSSIHALIKVNKFFEEYPIKVSTGGYIDAPFRIRIVNDDPEPVATLSTEVGQSLDISLQIVGLPFAKDEPVVVKLHAYVLSLKDYVSYRQVYGKLIFSVLDQLSFSTPEVEIHKESDIPVNLNVSIPYDFEKGSYVLAIQGHYEDKSGGTIVFLNIE